MKRSSTRAIIIVFIGLAAAILLAACGEDSQDAPELAALPTRTAMPVTATPEPDSLGAVAARSLQADVQTFLDEVQGIGPFERYDVLLRTLLTPNEDCLTGDFFAGMDPGEVLGINPVEVDLERWQQAADDFPEGFMLEQAREAAQAAFERLPLDGELLVCLVPVPGPPPDEAPNGGVQSMPFQGDTMLVTCAGGERCLEAVEIEVVHSYALAQAVERSGVSYFETRLIDFLVHYGRAEALVHAVYPNASLLWDEALTDEQAATLWQEMQTYFESTYSSRRYRYVNQYLFGGQNQVAYPRWGGVFLGGEIVRSYLDRHPDTDWPALFALSTDEIVAGSEYDVREPKNSD